jgi:hypothetical protein
MFIFIFSAIACMNLGGTQLPILSIFSFSCPINSKSSLNDDNLRDSTAVNARSLPLSNTVNCPDFIIVGEGSLEHQNLI